MFIEIPDHVEKFEKFAALVSQKSGIEIRMDGAKAQTNGKVIELPNIMGMTERETEFLYGILLHEIGHIKHSCFDKALFEAIKTDHHFLIVNAIEDARIENKMMEEYEGAKEIFDVLYNDFSNDPKFMAKIFGKEPSKNGYSAFFLFCMGLHSSIVKLPIKPYKCSKKTQQEVNDMLASVAGLLANAKLNSNQDSLELGTKIYEKIFEGSQDASQKVDIAGAEAKIEEDKVSLDGIMAELAAIQKQADAMKAGVKAIKGEKEQAIKDLTTHKKQTSPTLDANSKQYNDNLDKIRGSEEYQQAKSALNGLQNTISDINASMAKKTNKGQRSANKLAKSQGIEKAALDPKDAKKALTNEKRWANDVKKAELAKAANAPTLENLQKQVDEAKAALDNVANKPFTEDGKSVNDLKKENSSLSDANNPIHETTNNLEHKSQELSNKVREGLKDIRELKRQALAEAGKKIQELDRAMREAGVPGVLPEFEKANEWDEADEAQQDFDEEASDELDSPVVNGRSAFGSDVRNVIFRLQDVRNQLQEIDIAAIASKRLNVSKLDGVNDLNGDDTNATENAETNPNAPSNQTRPHLPLTTEFDRVIERVSGGNPHVLDPIRKAQATACAQLSNLLKLKFRFKQKQIYKHGKEEGMLDTREIYRVATPSLSAINIFETAEKRLDSKVSASVSVDISGSMDKDATEHGEKVKALALLLSDSLTNAHVRHEVIGYGAPVCTEMKTGASDSYNRRMNSLETQVFKTASGANGMQNLELQSVDNSDGESLRLAGSRLLKTGSKKKVMMVITDGKPFLTDADSSILDQDLHRALGELKKKGISIYAFGFNDAPKTFYGDNYCKVSSPSDVITFLSKKLEQVN